MAPSSVRHWSLVAGFISRTGGEPGRSVMEEFGFFTDRDRKDASYAACVGGATLVGAAVGRFALLPGLLAGAATGLAIGLLACERLSPAIGRKLFSQHERLSEQEVLQALRALRDETGVQTKNDAMYLLGHLRSVGTLQSHALSKEMKTSLPARIAAQRILAHRT